jgi:hypothetical protein
VRPFRCVVIDSPLRQYGGHRDQTIWAVVIAATGFENGYGLSPAMVGDRQAQSGPSAPFGQYGARSSAHTTDVP